MIPEAENYDKCHVRAVKRRIPTGPWDARLDVFVSGLSHSNHDLLGFEFRNEVANKALLVTAEAVVWHQRRPVF
jgi:hypothetical protein